MPIIARPLNERGAVVELLIGVSANRRRVLERNGFPVPEKIRLRAQLDIGSAVTVSRLELFRALEVSAFDELMLYNALSASARCELYQVRLSLLQGDVEFDLGDRVVVATPFSHEPDLDGLLGRDVLGESLLVYDGKAGSFTLAF